MNRDKKIIASCIIADNIIVKNGVQLFREDTNQGEQTKQPRLVSSRAETQQVREGTNHGVQSFLLSAYQQLELNYPKFYKMDQISKLGWLATEVLLKDGPLQDVRAEDMAIVLQNAHASLDTDVKYYETVSDIASPALFVYTLPNIVIGEISIRHKFKGENAFFVADTFDAALTEQYVGNLLDNNKATHCICGWVDVLEESYKAVLFLVTNRDNGIVFTAENMQKIFNGENL